MGIREDRSLHGSQRCIVPFPAPVEMDQLDPLNNTLLKGYDVTLSCAASSEDPRDIVKLCTQLFRKWAFQKERSETGYLHWQVRGWLWKKARYAQVKHKHAREFGGHWTPTTNGVHHGSDFNYVLKWDTREDGPWTDQDVAVEKPPLTRQLADFYARGPLPWMTTLREEIQKLDDRRIICVLDNAGNNAKSITVESWEYEGIAYEMPPFTCCEDLMQACMCIPPQKCYIIDMPRGMKKEKLGGFYSGLESLKNGCMYDKRHAFRKRRIDRPQILVFTNDVPDTRLLTPGRWQFFTFRNGELIDVTRQIMG